MYIYIIYVFPSSTGSKCLPSVEGISFGSHWSASKSSFCVAPAAVFRFLHIFRKPAFVVDLSGGKSPVALLCAFIGVSCLTAVSLVLFLFDLLYSYFQDVDTAALLANCQRLLQFRQDREVYKEDDHPWKSLKVLFVFYMYFLCFLFYIFWNNICLI